MLLQEALIDDIPCMSSVDQHALGDLWVPQRTSVLQDVCCLPLLALDVSCLITYSVEIAMLRVASVLTVFPLPTVKPRRNALGSLPTKTNSNVRAARLSFVPWSTTAAFFSCISPMCPASYSSLVRATAVGSGPNAAPPSSLGTQGAFCPPPVCHFRVFPQAAQVKRAPKAMAALSAYVTAPFVQCSL